MVKRLDEGALVDDLRDAFVEQQNLTATVPGTLHFSTADGTKLGEDHSVEPFFLIPGTQESSPGKSRSTPLMVTFPPPQEANEPYRFAIGEFFATTDTVLTTKTRKSKEADWDALHRKSAGTGKRSVQISVRRKTNTAVALDPYNITYKALEGVNNGFMTGTKRLSASDPEDLQNYDDDCSLDRLAEEAYLGSFRPTSHKDLARVLHQNIVAM
jgi:hypothetical protein